MEDWEKKVIKISKSYMEANKDRSFTLERAGLYVNSVLVCLDNIPNINVDLFKPCLLFFSKGDEALPSIMEEITTQIDTLQGKERERYIFELLMPFVLYEKFISYEHKYPSLFAFNHKQDTLFLVKDVIFNFACDLDLLLLKKGINLLWYQKEADMYILRERNMLEVELFFGTEKLAKRYIDEALPKIEPQQTPHAIKEKPQQEDLTDREKEYYQKAISKGMAKKTDNGYKWLYCGGSKVSLSYFLNKVFCPKGFGVIPFKKLEKLWGVKRLDSTSYQLANAKKPQRWRGYINTLFEK